MAAQSLVSVRFEKTETPARFEPMPSKKHADRMLHVTFGTHKKQSFGAETPERQQHSRASAKQKTVRNMDSERWLLKVSSASDSKRPKHQQDSSPCQAKNTQTECFTSPLEPIKNKASVPKDPNASSSRASVPSKKPFETWIPNDGCSKSRQRQIRKDRNTSKIRAHAKQKNTQTECFTSPLEPIKNKASVPKHPNASSTVEPLPSKKPFETWIPNDGCSKSGQRQIRKDRNTSKIRAHAKQKNTQTECFTSPLEPIKNKASVPKHPNASSSRASVPSKKPFETWIPNDGCSKSRQRQIRKDRNTSKIRAHAKQKNTQTECFTSPLEPIKNKASNASSSRASAKQKTVRNMDSERWLLKVWPASDSKRPKHQQDSSPCQAKKHADRMLHVTFGTHKKQSFGSETPERQQQSSLLCQAKNRSKHGFRTMAAQSLVSVFEKTETPARFEPMPSKKHADRMLHVTFGTHKKQSFGSETPERQQQSSLCQAKNRSKHGFRTMAAQSLISVRFEKTETPARFEPMPSKKHADKMLHVTFGTHKKQSFGSETPERQQQSSLCQTWIPNDGCSKSRQRQIRKDRNTSKIRAHAKQKNTQTECFTSPLEPIKNKASNASSSRASAKQKTVRNMDSERWLLKVSSASDSKRPKHQQDSSPCQAKNTQTECFKFGTHKKQSFGAERPERQQQSSLCAKQKTVRNVDSERWLLKVSSASDSKRPKHQQDSSPCQAKKHADRMLHVTFGTHKKQSFGAERPERQQQSSLCQAKNRSKRGFRTMAAQSLVSVRFEKTETPARFEPMPSKKTRRQNASRHLWNP